MAEPSFMDPSPFANFPQFDPADLFFSFPDGELPLPDGIISDLDLDDIDLDFSVDDLLIANSDENDNAGSGFNSNTNSGSKPGSPESGNSSAASRKMDDDDRVVNPNPSLNPSPSVNPSPNSNSNPSSRNLKIRRCEEVSSPSTFCAGTEEDEKRKLRLMRNRESAQLSRQRKKHYVDELEEKVKIMNSTIADLNGKISFYMAENARLHQQLNGNGGNGGGNGNGNGNGNPAASVYLPPPPPLYHFPWIPYAGYAMRPNRPPVPYLPIPRLKPQQHASAPRVKKSDSKKSQSKAKKVASVSLLGLLFAMMVFGGVINFGLGGSRDMVYGGAGGVNGRIFSVKGRGSGLNNTQEFGPIGGKMGSDYYGIINRYEKGREGPGGKQNSSESLPALLYVPRNGNHVEINGNLIIHSVLASERAMAQAKSNGQGKQSLGKEGTGLAIPPHVVASALAVPKNGREVGGHSKACRSSAEHPSALASDSHDTYGGNIKSTVPDGPLKQWFHEGLAGPILSSGTCTEVFQFDVSTAVVDPSNIIPANSVVNTTGNLLPSKIKNRRILYGQAIPLNGSTLNNTEPFAKPTESSDTFHGNNSVPSMVVSVMADPREAGDRDGDGDGDGMITSKSLSRIFVVVLMDSVRYVTYSCVLPLKSHGPHLVN